MVYSPITSELLTTHGYSLNELTLWKWGRQGQLEKIDSVMGHKRRVEEEAVGGEVEDSLPLQILLEICFGGGIAGEGVEILAGFLCELGEDF